MIINLKTSFDGISGLFRTWRFAAIICLSFCGVSQINSCDSAIASPVWWQQMQTNVSGSDSDSQASLKLPDQISFNAHIRPIMSNTCFVCHGPDKEANQSGLRLDSFEAAIEGGAIELGKPDDSLLYRRLISKDDPMPPAEFRHQLSEQDIALFLKWIEQGASYEQHWSFTPLQRPELPDVNQADRVANPIDRFVQSRLESVGLTLAPQADKRTLLRRLSLDLIGIPPTLDELNQFLNDDSSEAYQKQVDRLLASPHYGERMAVHWMDIVRFSDTVGFHGDQNQRVFAYRDYVIDSLNQNKKFDQFTLEQLAGDLLENPTDEQRIATALIRLNMMTREGGAQPGEYIAKYTAERVRMLGTAWLGLTTGCCECHNHKFDPLTIRDFYSLGAFFDDVQQWGVYHDYQYTPNPELRGLSNDSPFPPELRSPSQSLLRQIEFLETAMAKAIARELPKKFENQPAFREWTLALAESLRSNPDGWTAVAVESAVSSKPECQPKVLSDQSVLLTGAPVPELVVDVSGRLTESMMIKSIRLEVLPDPANQGRVGRSKEGRFTLTFSAASPADTPLAIALTQVDRINPNSYANGYEPYFLVGRWRSGPALWQLPIDETSQPHTAVYHLDSPLQITADQELSFQITSADVGRFRVSVSPLTRYVSGQPAATELLRTAVGKFQTSEPLMDREHEQLVAAHYLATTSNSLLSKTAQTYRDLIADCRSGQAMTLVAVQADPKRWLKTRVLPRGNWQDESGEVVAPETPSFLPKLTGIEVDQDYRRLTRMDLAKWLTSTDNPLTARHFVNRTWKQFFGTGLSGQLDDLGNQGEWPSHPELLDWLAAEFQADWDIKHLVRLIVTSNTYQQQCATNSQHTEIDPYNRLLAFQSPRRLEAEIVRDNALAISGLLSTQYIGGPSIFPYQPAGYYTNLQFPDRSYQASPFELQYRRGVYVHWQRTFLHPSFLNFDAPARDECAADRPGSNSPQQALSLLNDPQFVEASLAFARRIIAESPDDSFSHCLDHAFELALSRPATTLERESLERLYQKQLEHYANTDGDLKSLWQPYPQLSTQIEVFTKSEQVNLAAWSQVCRVILNLHETITRY